MDNLETVDFRKKSQELYENYRIWINKIKEQHQKYDAEYRRNFEEIPPAQDSPKHILNVLTDECIQKVLCYLDSYRDFFNVAETCTRFQNNAKICFPSEFSSFALTVTNKPDGHILPFHCVPKYLSIFGHLINFILWSNRREVRALDDTYFQMITESCGRSLSKFEIFDEHDLEFHTSPPFHVLDELIIRCSSIINFGFGPFTTLKKLFLRDVKIQNFDVPNEEIPTLESISFHSVEGLTDELLIRLLKYVPQLKVLQLHLCKLISPSIFQNVDQRIPNLEDLEFQLSTGVKESKQNEEDILELSKLKKLKRVRLYFNKISTVPLVDLFAEREVPIEYLTTFIPSLSESLYKLKRLKYFNYEISKETAIELLDKILTLERILVRLKDESTVSDIIEFLECALNHKINFINFHAEKISFDMENYHRILALSKNRIRIRLFMKENLADLNEEVVESNREWFKITDFKKNNDPECMLKKQIADYKVLQQEIRDSYRIYDIPDFI